MTEVILPDLAEHQKDYRKDSWKLYSEGEYLTWVRLLIKKSGQRSNMEKKVKDLKDARNYLSMLIARCEEQIKPKPAPDTGAEEVTNGQD